MSFKISHIKYYILALSVIIHIGQYYYTEGVKVESAQEIIEINRKQKEKYNQAIDSSIVEIERIKNNSTTRIDSILKTRIEYVKFEVPTYIDRTFDDAIRVHTEYKESGATY